MAGDSTNLGHERAPLHKGPIHIRDRALKLGVISDKQRYNGPLNRACAAAAAVFAAQNIMPLDATTENGTPADICICHFMDLRLNISAAESIFGTNSVAPTSAKGC